MIRSQKRKMSNELKDIDPVVVQELLPYVRAFAYTWLHLQCTRRKVMKDKGRKMTRLEELQLKNNLLNDTSDEKKKWVTLLLIKLVKDIPLESQRSFLKLIEDQGETMRYCLNSKPDSKGQMKRVDCMRHSDKVWRLDLVSLILFKGVPLDSTDSERLERSKDCTSSRLCVNPFHMLIILRDLDLYVANFINPASQSVADTSARSQAWSGGDDVKNDDNITSSSYDVRSGGRGGGCYDSGGEEGGFETDRGALKALGPFNASEIFTMAQGFLTDEISPTQQNNNVSDVKSSSLKYYCTSITPRKPAARRSRATSSSSKPSVKSSTQKSAPQRRKGSSSDGGLRVRQDSVSDGSDRITASPRTDPPVVAKRVKRDTMSSMSSLDDDTDNIGDSEVERSSRDRGMPPSYVQHIVGVGKLERINEGIVSDGDGKSFPQTDSTAGVYVGRIGITDSRVSFSVDNSLVESFQSSSSRQSLVINGSGRLGFIPVLPKIKSDLKCEPPETPPSIVGYISALGSRSVIGQNNASLSVIGQSNESLSVIGRSNESLSVIGRSNESLSVIGQNNEGLRVVGQANESMSVIGQGRASLSLIGDERSRGGTVWKRAGQQVNRRPRQYSLPTASITDDMIEESSFTSPEAELERQRLLVEQRNNTQHITLQQQLLQNQLLQQQLQQQQAQPQQLTQQQGQLAQQLAQQRGIQAQLTGQQSQQHGLQSHQLQAQQLQALQLQAQQQLAQQREMKEEIRKRKNSLQLEMRRRQTSHSLSEAGGQQQQQQSSDMKYVEKGGNPLSDFVSIVCNQQQLLEQRGDMQQQSKVPHMGSFSSSAATGESIKSSSTFSTQGFGSTISSSSSNSSSSLTAIHSTLPAIARPIAVLRRAPEYNNTANNVSSTANMPTLHNFTFGSGGIGSITNTGGNSTASSVTIVGDSKTSPNVTLFNRSTVTSPLTLIQGRASELGFLHLNPQPNDQQAVAGHTSPVGGLNGLISPSTLNLLPSPSATPHNSGTPFTTPRSTPIPRWCTPFILEDGNGDLTLLNTLLMVSGAPDVPDASLDRYLHATPTLELGCFGTSQSEDRGGATVVHYAALDPDSASQATDTVGSTISLLPSLIDMRSHDLSTDAPHTTPSSAPSPSLAAFLSVRTDGESFGSSPVFGAFLQHTLASLRAERSFVPVDSSLVTSSHGSVTSSSGPVTSVATVSEAMSHHTRSSSMSDYSTRSLSSFHSATVSTTNIPAQTTFCVTSLEQLAGRELGHGAAIMGQRAAQSIAGGSKAPSPPPLRSAPLNTQSTSAFLFSTPDDPGRIIILPPNFISLPPVTVNNLTPSFISLPPTSLNPHILQQLTASPHSFLSNLQPTDNQ